MVICAARAAVLSRTTSRMVPVLEGKKLWCHSSRVATSEVLTRAKVAHCKHQCVASRGNVARHDRKRSTLKMKYPTTCPVLRRSACQTANLAKSTLNKK
jgi:hypothetical protein